MNCTIRFFGAAGEVTGSCYLVETDSCRFLVDCGMFQGGKIAEQKNLAALSFGVKHIDFMLLTHAHLDHSGLIPRLVALGFRGKIYATTATVDVAAVILQDSAHIQEKEAEWANRHHHQRHAKRGYDRAPLYTMLQAQRSLDHFVAYDYDTPFSPLPGVEICFRDAGHILGSSIIECWLGQGRGAKKLVFSGDLGQPNRPVMCDPYRITEADYLLIESTYGNRCHKDLASTEAELVHAINDTLERKGGNVIIPAFAVGRTQELLFILTNLVRNGRIKPWPIYVDSPMAVLATELTLKHAGLVDAETQELMAWHQANPQLPPVHFVESAEESMELNEIRRGTIIISASGMCDAGRIKYHLLHNLGRKESSIIIAGFQAGGTLGRRLVDGARQATIFGNAIPVRADLYTIGGLSAHADQTALLNWLRNFHTPPRCTFIVHGEASAAEAFAAAIHHELQWQGIYLPDAGECVPC